MFSLGAKCRIRLRVCVCMCVCDRVRRGLSVCCSSLSSVRTEIISCVVGSVLAVKSVRGEWKGTNLTRTYPNIHIKPLPPAAHSHSQLSSLCGSRQARVPLPPPSPVTS